MSETGKPRPQEIGPQATPERQSTSLPPEIRPENQQLSQRLRFMKPREAFQKLRNMVTRRDRSGVAVPGSDIASAHRTNTTERVGLRDKLKKWRDGLIIENLEPTDWPLRLVSPGIIPEHLARYRFAAKFLEGQAGYDPNTPITAVDAASARGYGSNILSETLPKGSNVVGVEIDKKYINKAAKKYSPGNTDSPYFVQADVRKLPIKNNSVDLVTGFEITEHLPKEDQPEFINGIKDILKPGGVALLSIPYAYSCTVNAEGELVRGKSNNPHHLYEPTREDLIMMVKEAGLELQGEYGQVVLNKNSVERWKTISSKIPIWPIYAWMRRSKSYAVTEIPEDDPSKVSLTQIFAVQKPKATENYAAA